MLINCDDLLGVKYKEDGRTLDGLDCFGLVLEVSKRFGHKLKDFEYIKDSSTTILHAKTQIGDIPVYPVEKPEVESDIIIFKVRSSFENHCGVYLGDGLFIHCDCFGVHIQKLEDYPYIIGSVFRWQK